MVTGSPSDTSKAALLNKLFAYSYYLFFRKFLSVKDCSYGSHELPPTAGAAVVLRSVRSGAVPYYVKQADFIVVAALLVWACNI